MQITKKRGIIKSLFSVLLAMVIFVGIMPISPVKAQESTELEDYHTWRQMDPRWGSINMGGQTLAKVGCLITAISMMARASDSLDEAALENLGISSVEEFNPGVLANAYNKRNGFTYDGAIANWGTLHQIIPEINFVEATFLKSYTREGIAAEIKAMMDQGQHVILNVNWHWVYIEAVVGNDIYMIDPASDTVLLYDKYQLYGGNEYWALTCKNPPVPFNPVVSDKLDSTKPDPETTTSAADDTITTTETTASDNETTATTTTEKSTTSKNKLTTTTTSATTSSTTSTTTKLTTTSTSTTSTTTTAKTTTTTSSTTTTTSTTSTTKPTTTTTTTTTVTSASSTTTTTTTVSSSSGNTTTTTVSTSAVTANMAAGEYYAPEEKEIPIYDSPDKTGKPVAYVRMNEVVNALECSGTMGHIEGTDGFAGWIDLSEMTAVNEDKSHKRGDINGDGKIDMYDLGLLGEYLSSLVEMPDGVSKFTSCEKNAADINGDGKVTDADVLVCLMLVCN